MADLDLPIADKVYLAQRGLGGIATIAEFLSRHFANDVEISPAADGLHVLADATRDRLEEVAEELHNTRDGARMRPDPHIEWGATHSRAYAAADDEAVGDAEIKPMMEEAWAIEGRMAGTKAGSVAGAAAQVRCVLLGLKAQYGEDGNAPQTSAWIGALTLAAETLEGRA